MTNQHVVRTISRVGIPIILYPTNKTISTQNSCQTSHDIVLKQVMKYNSRPQNASYTFCLEDLITKIIYLSQTTDIEHIVIKDLVHPDHFLRPQAGQIHFHQSYYCYLALDYS